MKVSLINPDFSECELDPVAKRKFTPLSLAYSAAIFKNQGWNINFLDDNVFHYKLEKIINLIKNSDLIVISTGGLDRWQCPPLEIKRFYEVCSKIKKEFPSKIIIAEGPHTIFNYESLLKYVDYVIYGEPEQIIIDIVKTDIKNINKISGVLFLKNGKVCGKKENRQIDLEKLPIPLIEVLPYKKYSLFLLGTPTGLIETSRGCYFNCAFCFKGMFGKGVRFKSNNQVIKEIMYMVSLGIKNFRIMDLDFTANKKKLIEIFSELKKKKVKINWACDSRLGDINEDLLKKLSNSNCKLLMFGIESLSEDTHKKMEKYLDLKEIKNTLNLVKKYKIQTLGYFRFGYLNETKKDIEMTIANSLKLNLDFASCEIFVPYPTTKFFINAKEHLKRYSKDNIPLAYEKSFSYKELAGYVGEFNKKFYFRYNYILKHFYFIFNPMMIKEGLEIIFKRTKK